MQIGTSLTLLLLVPPLELPKPMLLSNWLVLWRLLYVRTILTVAEEPAQLPSIYTTSTSSAKTQAND